jgi:hypothetical protein
MRARESGDIVGATSTDALSGVWTGWYRIADRYGRTSTVMAGLVPPSSGTDAATDGRDKPGHDCDV